MGFIFGGNTGISGPEELNRRRAIAQALLERGVTSAPQNVGEGLAAIGAALGGRMAMNRLQGQEDEARRKATEEFSTLFSAPPAVEPVAYTQDGPESTPDKLGPPVEVKDYSSDKPGMGNLKKALLDTIAGPESAGRYDVVYGGGRFSDFKDHPRQSMPIKSGPNRGKSSSAAGRYQFLGSTWDQYKNKLGLPDFSPGSQDAAAWALASDTYRAKTGGDLEQALAKGDYGGVGKALSGVWTSLPGGIEQGIGGNQFGQAYQKNLGLAPGGTPQQIASADPTFLPVQRGVPNAGALTGGQMALPAGGVPSAQPAGAPMQLAQAGNGIDPRLMQIMGNPWLTPGQQMIARTLLDRQMQQSQPDFQTFESGGDMYRYNRNDQNSRPELFFDAPEPQSQFRPATPQEKAAYGVGPDVPLVIGEDGKPSILSEGGVTVNMPGQPNIGSIPQGYQALQDPNTKAWTMSQIPGGPAAAEAEEKARAEQNRVAGEQQRGGIVTQEIDRALGVMQGGILPDTGWGAMFSGIPGTDAKSLANRLETIKANIGFEELNKMRQQSPTGGALGQVTERELAFLQAVAGSLDQSQGQEELTDNLNRLWNAYQDTIHGPGQGPQRRPLQFEQEQQGGNAEPTLDEIEQELRRRGVQ